MGRNVHHLAVSHSLQWRKQSLLLCSSLSQTIGLGNIVSGAGLPVGCRTRQIAGVLHETCIENAYCDERGIAAAVC